MISQKEKENPKETELEGEAFFLSTVGKILKKCFVLESLTSLMYYSTSFAFSIWIYQSTESVTKFSLIGISTLAPAILFSPIAGMIVDRISLGRAIILGNALSILVCIAIVLVFILDAYSYKLLLLLLVFLGTFQSIEVPAYHALFSHYVPKNLLSQSNALLELTRSIPGMLSPIIGSFLIYFLTIRYLFLIPLFAMIIQTIFYGLIFLKTSVVIQSEKQSLVHDLVQVIKFLREKTELIYLLLFFLVANFFAELAGILLTPLGLHILSEAQLGVVLGVGSLGSIVGSLFIAGFGGIKNKKWLICIFMIFQGAILILFSKIPLTMVTFIIGIFLFLFLEAFLDNMDITIWQKQTPSHIRGKILSIKSSCQMLSLLLALLVSGILIDQVIQPLAGHSFFITWFSGKNIKEIPFVISYLVLGIFNILIVVPAIWYMVKIRRRDRAKHVG